MASESDRVAPAAESRRLVLEQTVTERYYVTDEALAQVAVQVAEGQDRDDALIELFQMHDGSQFGERFFYNDANPGVDCDVIEVDPDA